MLTHLKKSPALLSVYDALQMSQELRTSLLEVLSNPHDYQSEIGPPDRVACLATVSFTNKKKCANVKGHNRPIYIPRTFRNKPISHVMVDNR